jgi:hypothetical protein
MHACTQSAPLLTKKRKFLIHTLAHPHPHTHAHILFHSLTILSKNTHTHMLPSTHTHTHRPPHLGAHKMGCHAAWTIGSG